MEGEGEKRLTTNCGDLDFVVWRKKKEGFFLLFFIGFFLLFDFIALLLPIHHCLIYCLMMTTCDMMLRCSHYCIRMFFFIETHILYYFLMGF